MRLRLLAWWQGYTDDFLSPLDHIRCSSQSPLCLGPRTSPAPPSSGSLTRLPWGTCLLPSSFSSPSPLLTNLPCTWSRRSSNSHCWFLLVHQVPPEMPPAQETFLDHPVSFKKKFFYSTSHFLHLVFVIYHLLTAISPTSKCMLFGKREACFVHGWISNSSSST